MIDHFLVIETIGFAIGTEGFSLEILQMFEKMRPKFVVDSRETFDAKAADFGRRRGRRVSLDFDVRGEFWDGG